jgi:hypothetical protein
MSHQLNIIDNIEVVNSTILEGEYICNKFSIINELCIKIKYIYATIYSSNFSLYIKKTKEKLKIKINAISISKDLINFLNFLPYNLDDLVIPQLIIKETLNNLPVNLKKITIINYAGNEYWILDNLKKTKLPHDIKIILKDNAINKKLVVIEKFNFSIKDIF